MNKDTAIANAEMNRINQFTPEGSLTFNRTGTNPDGTPIYESHQTYSPEQQKLYENQLGISNALTDTAGTAIGRVNDTLGKNFNFDGMTPLQTSYGASGNVQYGYDPGGKIQTSLDFSGAPALPGINDFSADAQKARDNAYSYATSRLDPAYEAQQRKLAATLAAKGVSENSTASRNAQGTFDRGRNDAYNQAIYGSYGAGGQEQSRLFGLGLQARQQAVGETTTQGEFANAAQAQQYGQNAAGAAFNNTAQAQDEQQQAARAAFNNQGRNQQIQEATYLRNLPLQDINALIGQAGGVQAPNFEDYASANVGGVDYAGMVKDKYNADMEKYKADQASRGGVLGGLFGLAGNVASKLKFAPISDRRAKRDITQIGELANGIKTYVFRYLRDSALQFGVMADEVIKVRPDAIVYDPSGYMRVDYGKVW